MTQLHVEFIKTAIRHSKKFAIIDYTTEKRIPYSKALIASLIVAKKIKKYSEGFIGVMIPNSAGSMLSILGILMAGKVPVMINYATGAQQNAEYAQKKCSFKTIITSKALLEKINCPQIPGMIFIEEILSTVTIIDKLSAAFKTKLPLLLLLKRIHTGEMDDNLVILFTSGSEKEPKAVQLTHRNIASNLQDIRKTLKFTEDDIMLANLPLFHVFGHTVNFWLPLTTGMSTVPYANPIDYAKIVSIIKQEKISVMAGTPTFFRGYLKVSKPGDFVSVRIAVPGADKCPESLLKGYKEKHNITLLEGYGTTETSPVISVNTPDAYKAGSIGKPLSDISVKIQDIITGETLPPCKEGKIMVKGDLVMKGYFDDIEETSLRINNGWYDTGDMGILDDDGFLWHCGRLKRFGKIGGEMVSLVKVENILEQLIPEGCECCVVEAPDSIKGSRIVAVVTEKLDENAIIKQMATQLPFIALPKQFIVMKDLPKMASGKIDFRHLTDIVKENIHLQ